VYKELLEVPDDALFQDDFEYLQLIFAVHDVSSQAQHGKELTS
jgi:hypothetical protein